MTTELVSKIVNQHKPTISSENEPQQQQSRFILNEKIRREEEKLAYVKGTLNPKKLRILEAICILIHQQSQSLLRDLSNSFKLIVDTH